MHSHFRSNQMKCCGRVRGREEEQEEQEEREEELWQKVAERYTQRLRTNRLPNMWSAIPVALLCTILN